MKQIEDKIEENLKKQFNLLIPGKDAPADLKREVFNTLDTLNFLGDLADLFTTKFTQTQTLFLDLLRSDESDV